MDAQAAALGRGALDQPAGDLGADEAGDSGVKRPAPRELENQASVAQESEADLRVRERLDADGLFEVTKLSVLAAQKLPPRGHVEKKIPDVDHRARRAAPVANLAQFAPLDADGSPRQRLPVRVSRA